jgi:RHS repeat-associated protein
VAGQATISYGYDNAGRLTSITQGSAVVSFEYDDANRRTWLTLPNGVQTEYAYDAASRLTGLTYKHAATTLGTLTYSYDAGGRRTKLSGTWARTLVPTAVASATYDAANQQTAVGGQTLTYDLNGNLTGDGAHTYTWNARNQLAAIGGPTPASFVYDGVGRRQRKAINGTLTDFVYDGLNPVREASGANTIELLTGLGIDEYFVRTDPSGSQTLLREALGSTVSLIDASGSVQTEYSYEPFGTTTASGAASGNELGYTGREADGTGLHYYRARYYYPTFQRFIAEGPIGFAGGDTNLYAYVWNSPTGLVDALGLDAWSDAGNLAAGFGDTISLGGTAWIRGLWSEQFGLPDTVDQGSGWNLAGRKAAKLYDAVSMVVGGVGVVRAAAAAPRVGRSLLTVLRNERGAIGFDANQDALIQIAKMAKNLGGVTREEAAIFREWAREYGVFFRGPEAHAGRGFGRFLHILVGPINHILVR